MRRGAFALVSLLIAFTISDARARQTEVAVDGCAMLARAVYSEVSSSVVYGPGKAGPWLIEQGRGDIMMCEHVARTVSRAFTSAMLNADIDVSWRYYGREETPGQGRYCLSSFLSQCYPASLLTSAVASRENDLLVQRTWAIVVAAVMREMYNPHSSDEISFRSNDLKLRLGLSLRTINGRDDRRTGR